jgi:hypothetical protein
VRIYWILGLELEAQTDKIKKTSRVPFHVTLLFFVSKMDDTNVKLTIDLGYKVLQHFNKISHKVALTIDIGPNVMLAIKYIAGSLLIYKSIDVSKLHVNQKKNVTFSSINIAFFHYIVFNQLDSS